MCVACLELSTQPCQHRWYRLHRRCSADFHLGNCPNKLQLHGWETRTACCPFCEDWPQKEEQYRLLGQTYGGGRTLPAVRLSHGNTSTALNPSSSTSSSPSRSARSRTPSLSRHLSQTRHDSNHNTSTRNGLNRRGSSGAVSDLSARDQNDNYGNNIDKKSSLLQDDTFGSSSEDTYSSLTRATGTKNRAMNDRLNSYFSTSVSEQRVDDDFAGYDDRGPEEVEVVDIAAGAGAAGKIPSSLPARDHISGKKDTQVDMSVLTMPLPTSAIATSNCKISALPASDTISVDNRKELTVKSTRKKKGMSTNLGKKLGFLFLN